MKSKVTIISSRKDKDIQIICIHCRHRWITKSKRKYVTCPNCLRKTPMGGK